MELWGVEREGGSGSVENGGVGGDERSGRFVGGGARGGGGRKEVRGGGEATSFDCVFRFSSAHRFQWEASGHG